MPRMGGRAPLSRRHDFLIGGQVLRSVDLRMSRARIGGRISNKTKLHFRDDRCRGGAAWRVSRTKVSRSIRVPCVEAQLVHLCMTGGRR